MPADAPEIELTSAQLLERAEEYAAQAATATAADIREALYRLARRFAALAGEGEAQTEEED